MVDVEEEEEEDEVDVTEIITDVIVVIRSVRTPTLSPHQFTIRNGAFTLSTVGPTVTLRPVLHSSHILF